MALPDLQDSLTWGPGHGVDQNMATFRQHLHLDCIFEGCTARILMDFPIQVDGSQSFSHASQVCCVPAKSPVDPC